MKKWGNIRRNLPAVTLLLLLLAAWELVSKLTDLPEYRLPAPSSIGAALAENIGLLTTHAQATLLAVGAGLLLAIIVATALAVSMDRWPLIKRALYPVLVISQTIPIFALAPLFLIWFGLGLQSKIVVVALVCFFPLAVNLVEGLEQVDPEGLELLQIMQASPWMTFTAVRLPAVLPYFYSGLKISVTYSVMGAVIGEWLGARSGLGVFMIRSFHSFKTPNLFAAILLVVLLSLFLFKLTEFFAWLTMPWHRSQTNQQEE